MKGQVPEKIHIIGSVGSGKTTLARNLSVALNMSFYELDNVVWKRSESGDRRRTDEERDELYNKIIHSDSWIIEGASFHDWVLPSFEKADAIIFLDTNYSKRKFRITKRFIFQKLGLEKANYKPTYNMFRKMFEWNSDFENISKHKIIETLTKFEDKSIVLKDNIEIESYINNWKNSCNKRDCDKPII